MRSSLQAGYHRALETLAAEATAAGQFTQAVAYARQLVAADLVSDRATLAPMAVLAARFPSDADSLNGLADQAGISRIYGGIHYRFDMDAGLALGRTVARYALQHDVNGHDPYALK